MLYFNAPPFTGKEFEYMKQAVDAGKISGDGRFVAVIGFLMFASVMGYIVLAFRTWGMENWMKSGNQPEKKAITEAINKLQKKAKKANKKKSDEGS